MGTNTLQEQIRRADSGYESQDKSLFEHPKYDPTTHYIELARSGYFRALLTLRHYIKATSDFYFSVVQNATNVDLFMMTPSISSPMGPGSDSETIPITFGELHTFLVDSSQFGFEPLLMNGMDKVYCYLPSMRGENPDKRHLNQFFHCEAEVRGGLETLTPVIEGYIKALCQSLSLMPNIIERISLEPNVTKATLSKISSLPSFKKITFDEAIVILRKSGNAGLFTETEHGCDMSSQGELEIDQMKGELDRLGLHQR